MVEQGMSVDKNKLKHVKDNIKNDVSLKKHKEDEKEMLDEDEGVLKDELLYGSEENCEDDNSSDKE